MPHKELDARRDGSIITSLRFRSVLVLLVAFANPLWAQTCRPPTSPTCEQKCGPIREGDEGKHAQCIATCTHTPICPPDFTVAVAVSGLNGGLLRIGEIGSPLLAITASGTYSFPVKVPYGHPYAVSILTQPPN